MANSEAPFNSGFTLEDELDAALFDLFQATGILTNAEETDYDRKFVVRIARSAYGQGLADAMQTPESTEILMRAVRRRHKPK